MGEDNRISNIGSLAQSSRQQNTTKAAQPCQFVSCLHNLRPLLDRLYQAQDKQLILCQYYQKLADIFVVKQQKSGNKIRKPACRNVKIKEKLSRKYALMA